MQRAQQTAVLQATNIGLVQIRGIEINYYVNLYGAFGLTAAIVGGFAYSALTQIDLPLDLPPPVASYDQIGYDFIGDVFWVSTAICMCASMHVILTTTVVSVLGPALALHGKEGSMAKAASGMNFETQEIFYAYNIMILSFAASILASCWVLMTEPAAIASTAILLVNAIMCYTSCRRIVDKFHYNRAHLELDFDDMDKVDADQVIGDDAVASDSLLDSEITVRHASSDSYVGGKHVGNGIRNAITSPLHSNGDLPNNSNPSSIPTAVTQGKRKSIFGGYWKISGYTALPDTHEHVDIGDPKLCRQGYVTLKDRSGDDSSSSGGSKNQWLRCYLVVGAGGQLYYYESKQKFKEQPGRPIRSRPIIINEHSISMSNAEDIINAKFEVTLTPSDGRGWTIRFDSEEELELWVTSFAAIQSSK